jgi:hypothetical protein
MPLDVWHLVQLFQIAKPDREPSSFLPADAPGPQATYISWTNQLLSNITRLRALEAAAANSSSSSSSSSNGLPPFWQAPKDIPFSQLYSDWIASNSKTWQPEQVQAANAIMTINVQVGRLLVEHLVGAKHGW